MPLIQTIDQMNQVVRRLRDAKDVTYDSETSGLDAKRCHIVGHVFTFSPDPKDSFYIPVRHFGGGNVPGCSVPQDEHGWAGDDHPIEAELRDLGDKNWLGHNIPFDNRMLHRHRVTLRGHFEDTGLNAALLDEYARSYSLENLALDAKVQAKLGQQMYDHIAKNYPQYYAPKAKPGSKGVIVAGKDAMAHYWRTDARDFIVHDYAAGDGTSTWQLRDWQRPRLEEQGLMRVWDIECRLIPVLHRMTVKGIRIDMERLDQVEAEVKQKLEEAMNSFPSGFNVRGADVRDLVLASGIDPAKIPRTKPSRRAPQGNMSFNADFLKTIPIGKKIIRARQYEHLLNSFINPLRETHIFEGRVHSSFNQLKGDDFGTITGRLSSSEPNMQQIPKRDKELGPLFRSIFIPDEGMIWGSVDYSQCEPRLLALYGRVKVLLEGYRAAETVDAHSAVAVAAGIDRDYGKRLNQALITGAGLAKVEEMLNAPNSKQIMRDYFDALPEIKPLQKRAATRMRVNGFVMSLLGRRARLEPGRDYTAVNRLLQCGNADILKLKMVEVYDYLESEGHPIDILLNCHDANDFQYTPENEYHYEECLKIMANFGEGEEIRIDLPMEVDSGIGANWAEATYGKNKKVVRGTYCDPFELREEAA
jgi:DNA polymerase I-like protein with 3'-5' exonuclease and polymerase domains